MNNTVEQKTPSAEKTHRKRGPNEYALFVKASMGLPEIKALKPKDRFKKIAGLWALHKQAKKQ